MAKGGEAAFSPQARARMLAKQAARLANEGKRAESERAFRRAFEEAGRVRGPLGSLKNDVAERSKLATILADEAVSAGMSAAFAVEMWKLGCNSGVLDEDTRCSTHIFYPLEIMDMARREKEAAQDDAPPPVSCRKEEEKGFGIIEFLGKITWLGPILGWGRQGKGKNG